MSEKHGGLTQQDNLAYACFSCNRNKGSDIASVEPVSGGVVRFFHPRRDKWHEHFSIDERDGYTVLSLTASSEATIRIFRLNDSDRLLERQALQFADRYPTEAAQRLLEGNDAS